MSDMKGFTLLTELLDNTILGAEGDKGRISIKRTAQACNPSCADVNEVCSPFGGTRKEWPLQGMSTLQNDENRRVPRAHSYDHGGCRQAAQ